MGALAQIHTAMSENDYLAHYAQHPDGKYEYINGEIWAMAGSSIPHNIITGNVFVAFHRHLRQTACTPYMESIQVQVKHNYYYPDVVVNCSENTGYIAQKPILIVEVLSDSTRKPDLTLKLHDYKNIPTLQEYILIEQDFMAVTVYRRAQNWQATTYIAANEVIVLDSIDCRMSVADIYETVVFDEK